MNKELNSGEPHPAVEAVESARQYLLSIPFEQLCLFQEAFSSCAIEGNRLAEICSETINRILTGKPVSDRLLLGLVWAIGDMKELEELLSRALADHTHRKPLQLASACTYSEV